LPEQQGFASVAFDVKPVLTAIDADIENSIERMCEVLRFASVATDPAHARDCRQAADWMTDYFRGLGFTARQYETTGQPAVIAEYVPPAIAQSTKHKLPHILFYGHYDVQPADPLDLWHSPPFEPRRGKNRHGQDCIFARGSADDKGQLMTFTEASRAWLAVHGALPFRLTVLIEGDEEGDASHIDRFVAANKQLLKADVVVICDTGMWDDDRPSIVTTLRGCISDEVEITGPKLDLHSGYFGGPAMNPLRVLSGILGKMFDAKGKITIPGFYEGVKKPGAPVKARLAKTPFNAPAFLKAVGLKAAAGETDFSLLEQMWFRPTAEINGLWGGYMGPGSKTVIPSKAHAKLTFRLVAGQDPTKVKKAFRNFVRKALPLGFRVKFAEKTETAAAVSVADDSPWIAAAQRALKAEWGKSAIMSGEGGSIPVVESFKKHLGLDSILIGWVREGDGLHSPNEKYDIEAYHKGTRSFARLIGEIANSQRSRLSSG
jgi:acetylornithine deacetylase/succinyl-diaminopimelate desuccinylase-like protein